MRLIPVILISLSLTQTAWAKTPLSQVAVIDDALMEIAIADEIRKSCDGIRARMLRALSRLDDLQDKAKAMGYSKDEIDDYVTSKSEKRRMRAKAAAYLESKGVESGNTDQLCAFGKAEIKRKSGIGTLLR
ncbi:hypothetical protein TRP8649_02669 [Pelagimonas phthalicica]|uniref:DUF5333 domain-containing protein n=1 Tax=Pelagimonas phthalicica TaxID=1037362 RepID=A0A238JEB3_9RHOB|nr:MULTISPECIES: DUF5333 domain-containing protein [Roseobacteraceae]MBO9464466.1 DUF5333 domain-containing protein [Tropicibacter sp. R15_0]TDS91495.1 hypothetical protein CLV87_2670 [Pelagimonas phthalicica]SMX28544.1 hypothetical protein TRP8649_02669 [Pelagimonas phthalicica]